MIPFNLNRDEHMLVPGMPILWRGIAGLAEATFLRRISETEVRVRDRKTSRCENIQIDNIEEIGTETNYARWKRLADTLQPGDLVDWEGEPDPIANLRSPRAEFCHIAKGGHLVLRPIARKDTHVRLAPRKVKEVYRWKQGKNKCVFW